MLKISVFGVILIRIQSRYGKIRTRITPNTDTFYAVVHNGICHKVNKRPQSNKSVHPGYLGYLKAINVHGPLLDCEE